MLNSSPIIPSKLDPSKKLGERLRQIFAERGVNFLERENVRRLNEGSATAEDRAQENRPDSLGETGDSPAHAMTSEELLKLRMEILPLLQSANTNRYIYIRVLIHLQRCAWRNVACQGSAGPLSVFRNVEVCAVAFG